MDLPLEMYHKYVQRRRDDLCKLQSALAIGRVDEFTIIGHQIKGNAASFDFADLAVIAEKMEKLDPHDLQVRGAQLLNDFANWIESAQIKLDSH